LRLRVFAACPAVLRGAILFFSLMCAKMNSLTGYLQSELFRF